MLTKSATLYIFLHSVEALKTKLNVVRNAQPKIGAHPAVGAALEVDEEADGMHLAFNTWWGSNAQEIDT